MGSWQIFKLDKPDLDFSGLRSGWEVPNPKPGRIGQQGLQPDPTLTNDKSR